MQEHAEGVFALTEFTVDKMHKSREERRGERERGVEEERGEKRGKRGGDDKGKTGQCRRNEGTVDKRRVREGAKRRS